MSWNSKADTRGENKEEGNRGGSRARQALGGEISLIVCYPCQGIMPIYCSIGPILDARKVS